MRDNVILPFSPEDDLTYVTPIVYHVSITETGDVETFIKRIKLALRKVMKEQNDVSFQVRITEQQGLTYSPSTRLHTLRLYTPRVTPSVYPYVLRKRKVRSQG